MKFLFLSIWLRFCTNLNDQCNEFNKMIFGLSAKEVIANYAKLYQYCSEQAAFIPSFLPLKNYEQVHISSLYGNRVHPIKGIVKHHGGVDIACKVQEVIATGSGVVAETGYNNGLGKYISINHLNGFVTTYAHLSEIVGKLDDRITIGQTIGIAGNTGMATGTHLHYEVRKNGIKQNPIDYLLLFHYANPSLTNTN